MKRALIPVVLIVMALLATTAHAQFPQGPANGPGYNQPVSPYLNLLRRGSDPAINYYGIVRPEIATQRSLQGLQQQINTVGALTAADAQSNNQLSTGHPIMFNNYSHYFGNSPGGGTGSRQSAPGRAPGTPPPTAGASMRPTGPPH
jgi:hypothetical protein